MTTDLALQLLASAMTLAGMWMIGDMSAHGFIVALASEVVWFALIIRGRLWGLLPLTIVLAVVHFRNYLVWVGT
jgi:hypothetical protein